MKATLPGEFNTSFLTEYFSDIDDPRRTCKGNIRHRFTDILLLVSVSVLCKCSDWDEMELFGRQELDWPKKYGDFSNGIPSKATLRRVVGRLDPTAFGACFTLWAGSLSGASDSVAIDGKTVRGARDKGDPGSVAPHILSAMAGKSGICLGQVATDEKSNETTAIPELLRAIDVGGCTVTIDAMGCQTGIAREILAQGADYVLAVKGNQAGLLEAVGDTDRLEAPADVHVWDDCGHGRVERRTAKVWKDLSHYDGAAQWAGLASFIKVERERYCKTTGKQARETAYHISSLDLSAKRANELVRGHWAVENKLHWTLDVVFGEDSARKRSGNSAENMNMVMKMALALVNRETTFKKSKKNKQLRALLDREYREKLLGFK